MSWLHPQYLWALLGVPAATGLLLWAAWRRSVAARSLGDPELIERLIDGISPRRRRWKGGLFALAALMVAIALAGPRMGTQLKEVKREGIDLIIALDVSLSMQAEDVSPNRLQRAKNEIKRLLGELQGDRVGLVIFSGDAFLQCPLTTDYGALRLFLDVADPSLLPTPGTDFGAAVKVAIKALDVRDGSLEEADRTRALLIVSDGENHAAGTEEVRKLARDAHVTLFTAGVGESDGAPIPVYRNGQRVGYKTDGIGRVVSTRLEEEALQTLATDGAYFRIARTSSSLSQLTAALNRLEKTEFASEAYDEYAEQYQWPLALGLLLLVVERMVSDRRRTAQAARMQTT